ncbi:DNA-protecting protein DprA [Lysobacteraceae bacterium NML08-0793]|nr:DNA-protecting protein DprA [Xanthomonadaceae bacterium NML08-0793]
MPRDTATTTARLRLIFAQGSIAPRRLLLERFGGNADQALNAGSSAWQEAGLNAAQIARLGDRGNAIQTLLRRSLAWLEAPDHHLLFFGDADYPALLAQSADPPLALFVAGEPGYLWQPQIAIVGSRRASVGGRENAHAFARQLALRGFAISSGLAAGIDRAAHEGALSCPDGLTLAILGCGIDTAYPASHRALMQTIAERGALVSEYPPGTPPLQHNFPARNRIVAALSAGTLVVEAAERSGALITARLAAEAGREVFALPGSIHNPMARGCHHLLRNGATLATCPEDIASALLPMLKHLGQALQARLDAEKPTPATIAKPLSNDLQDILQVMGYDPVTLDMLVERTGQSVTALASRLLTLELEGHIQVEHGRYTRSHRS